MLPYQERVVEESEELRARIDALGSFLEAVSDDLVDPAELSRMHRQFQAMATYHRILIERIKFFRDVELTEAVFGCVPTSGDVGRLALLDNNPSHADG